MSKWNVFRRTGEKTCEWIGVVEATTIWDAYTAAQKQFGANGVFCNARC